MISKERIDELLMKRAKIYGIGKQGNIFCLELKFRPEALKNKKWLENKYKVYSKFFETKEEAEWHKEFGCIERLIKLDLPNWEKINKDNNFYYIRNYNINKNFSFFIEIYNFTKTITLRWNNGCTTTDDCFYRVWELTKENYYDACRKCKELFLGE